MLQAANAHAGGLGCLHPGSSRLAMEADAALWFALSVYWVADMIGIDGHVSFLPQKKKKKKKNAARQYGRCVSR